MTELKDAYQFALSIHNRKNKIRAARKVAAAATTAATATATSNVAFHNIGLWGGVSVHRYNYVVTSLSLCSLEDESGDHNSFIFFGSRIAILLLPSGNFRVPS